MLNWVDLTDKQIGQYLNRYLMGTGALAGVWEFIAENADGFLLFLAGAVIPAATKIWLFVLELRMTRDRHRMEIEMMEQEKRQDQERHQKEMRK